MKAFPLLAQVAAITAVSDAVASQGPGTVAGSASSTMQTGMAVVVYGLCASTLALALIRALARRS